GAVPEQRVERGKERDGGRRLRRRLKQPDVLAYDEALSAQALDLDGNELAELDQLRPQRTPSRALRPPRIWLRRAEPPEGVAAAAEAEQAVRAVARKELVPELLPQREVVRDDVGRQQ